MRQCQYLYSNRELNNILYDLHKVIFTINKSYINNLKDKCYINLVYYKNVLHNRIYKNFEYNHKDSYFCYLWKKVKTFEYIINLCDYRLYPCSYIYYKDNSNH